MHRCSLLFQTAIDLSPPVDVEHFCKVKFSRFHLSSLSFQHSRSLFDRSVPEHSLTCTDTFECKFPCPYESGFNKYVYLDGSIFSDERLKLGEDNLIVKHELRSKDGFLKFVDYQSAHSSRCRSPYVGKRM